MTDFHIDDLRIGGDAGGTTINERVRLTTKEYELLRLLWLHQGKVLSRQVMLEHLYSGVDEPGPRMIDVFIGALRFKISKATDGKASIKIAAVGDSGYVLEECN